MRLVAVFVAVLGISIVQLYVAGPLGLAWGLDRNWVALASFVGGMVGVVALVIVGPGLIDRITKTLRWLFRRPQPVPDESPAEAEQPGRFERLVDRFGAPFLGIVGPLTVGGWAAAILGSGRGIGRLRLIGWLAVGQALVTASYVYALAEVTD